jgi:hypothetical protein
METCCSTREKRRRRFGVGVTVVNLFVGFSVFFLLISCSGVQAFFIDLESLGFSTGKSDEGIEESSGAKLLVAAPSELEEIVEVEKTDDPNKSVKLSKSFQSCILESFYNKTKYLLQLWENSSNWFLEQLKT